MILSDRQYGLTQGELAKMRQSLVELEIGISAGETDWTAKLHADALRSQIGELEAELSEYELLKSGQVVLAAAASLAELPRMLVQARIVNGLNQTELAEKLKMKPQQIQRYEASNYMGASLARLIEVADALGVKISEAYDAPKNLGSGAIFSWADAAEVLWSRMPLKEMLRRGWFSAEPKQNLAEIARDYFISRAGPQFASALHRKKVHAGNIPNEFALLAWQARVLALARDDYDAGDLEEFELNDSWLPELVALTRSERGAEQAKPLLARHGIALVIERHLSGTYLDGAAMFSDFGNPVVALTLRHDRLDNFWFVLFHELGHVFRHLSANIRFDFFDEEEVHETDSIEREADEFALRTLIPDDKWETCLSRFTLTPEAVRLDAQSMGVGESIVAGRIRKERNNYMILNELVGHKAVRVQFEETDE